MNGHIINWSPFIWNLGHLVIIFYVRVCMLGGCQVHVGVASQVNVHQMRTFMNSRATMNFSQENDLSLTVTVTKYMKAGSGVCWDPGIWFVIDLMITSE